VNEPLSCDSSNCPSPRFGSELPSLPASLGEGDGWRDRMAFVGGFQILRLRAWRRRRQNIHQRELSGIWKANARDGYLCFRRTRQWRPRRAHFQPGRRHLFVLEAEQLFNEPMRAPQSRPLGRVRRSPDFRHNASKPPMSPRLWKQQRNHCSTPCVRAFRKRTAQTCPEAQRRSCSSVCR